MGAFGWRLGRVSVLVAVCISFLVGSRPSTLAQQTTIEIQTFACAGDAYYIGGQLHQRFSVDILAETTDPNLTFSAMDISDNGSTGHEPYFLNNLTDLSPGVGQTAVVAFPPEPIPGWLTSIEYFLRVDFLPNNNAENFDTALVTCNIPEFSEAINTPVASLTPTASETPLPTATTTETLVPTATTTETPLPTATSTETPLPTATATETPVPTATPTETPVPTATSTETPIPTATSTETPVPTPTSTETPVPTATATETPLSTATSTETPFPTATSTETPVLTATSTETPVPTATSTETPVPTATSTETPLPTATSTETPLPTATSTETPIPTATTTETPVPTATPTETPLPTATSTETAVPTAASTETPVPTATSTEIPVPTPTETLFPTATSTETPIPTATSTETPIPTATSTETPIPTSTSSETPLPTATATETPVPAATVTETPVPTATSTEIPVSSATATATPESFVVTVSVDSGDDQTVPDGTLVCLDAQCQRLEGGSVITASAVQQFVFGDVLFGDHVLSTFVGNVLVYQETIRVSVDAVEFEVLLSQIEPTVSDGSPQPIPSTVQPSVESNDPEIVTLPSTGNGSDPGTYISLLVISLIFALATLVTLGVARHRSH